MPGVHGATEGGICQVDNDCKVGLHCLEGACTSNSQPIVGTDQPHMTGDCHQSMFRGHEGNLPPEISPSPAAVRTRSGSRAVRAPGVPIKTRNSRSIPIPSFSNMGIGIENDNHTLYLEVSDNDPAKWVSRMSQVFSYSESRHELSVTSPTVKGEVMINQYGDLLVGPSAKFFFVRADGRFFITDQYGSKLALSIEGNTKVATFYYPDESKIQPTPIGIQFIPR